MSFSDYLRELAFPLESSATLIALTTFILLLALAWAAGLFGLWLLIVTIPAFLRYLTMVAEARAQGRDAAPPGIEFFSLVGNGWTLFSVVPVLVMAMVVRELGGAYGSFPALIVSFGFAALLPAIIGVLVITHSPLESLDPRAIDRFIHDCGESYWYAPTTAVLIVLVPELLFFLPGWGQIIVEVYLVTAFFAVIGAVTRNADLIEDVEIPDSAEPDAEKVLGAQEGDRIKALNHAYGFISRGNRDGGMRHIYDWLTEDPDPGSAWPWFLEEMLRWEDNYPGLLLAQQYVGRLLEHGDKVSAVKLILRCRMLNERFRPLSADLDKAIEAAEFCQNLDLAKALSQ